MRAVRRLQFQPTTLAPDRPTPIDRYLDRDDHAIRGMWALSEAPTRVGVSAMSLRDTGSRSSEIEQRGDAATIWHLLWVRDELAARVSIGDDAWSIAPGDSVVVPPGAALRAEGRQLAVGIAVPGIDVPVMPPTHGEERYFGYNRQTISCSVGTIRICRWKLTQPLALAEHYENPLLVLALARDSVVRTTTEIDRLRQGELALIDPTTNPTVTPDGLSYLLTIDRDPSTS